MTPIPAKIKRTLERMPRMRMCEMSWSGSGTCEGRIEWHHVWEYTGRQIQEVWAILGACSRHHAAVKTDVRVKEGFERRSLEIATDAELEKYPKRAWRTLRKYLEAKAKQR